MIAIIIPVSILIIVSLLAFYSNWRSYPKNYPPGPIGIPILGNLLSVGNAPHLAFQRYAKIYGPIFSLRMGPERAVILHGSKLIKEAFADVRLSGRAEKEAIATFFGGGLTGVVMSHGSIWTEQRRFALRQLRDFGFGKQSMEGLIMDEVNELIEWIKGQQETPVDLCRKFKLAIVNSLWAILCGQRFEHDDSKLLDILEQFEATANAVLGGKGKSLLILFYPHIAKMFPNFSGWNFLLESIKPRHAIFKAEVDEHKRTLADGIPRDFVDAYLMESRKATDPNSMFHPDNVDTGIQSVMAEFFIAGADTTSTTLSWAILFLVHYQEIQTKIRNEIERSVGNYRQPSLTDRNELPYAEAFIMEVTRFTSIVSWGVPHCALTDVEFHGFQIPKGTTIYSSLYSSHHDESVWGDPQNFRPERFLSSDGTKVQRHEALIPFSTGKRVCLGEALARDQSFLFVTNLVQRFVIDADNEKPKPTLEPNLGQLTLEPHHYKVVAKNRMN